MENLEKLKELTETLIERDTTIKNNYTILKSVVDNFPVGLNIVSADGRIIVFNKEAERVCCTHLENLPLERIVEYYGVFYSDMKTPYKIEELYLSEEYS